MRETLRRCRRLCRAPIALLFLLVACAAPTPPAATTAVPPTTAPATAPSVEPGATGTGAASDAALPPAVEYDLGEATIVQARFPEDSRFRNMPVRLNGVIAAPEGEGGPHPVVVILHGTHPGCPVDEGGVDRWPCDAELEQPNYRGFGSLVSQLAAEGYVALSININAENTFGFGEATPGERLRQIVDRHLEALVTASEGGANSFGVDLAGRADLGRLAFAGHSRGAEAIYVLAHADAGGTMETLPGAEDGAAESGEGVGTPVLATAEIVGDLNPLGIDGLLMIAPAIVFADPATGSRVPLAQVLAACDADVSEQEGKHFYEGARLAPGQTEWASSVLLDRANHNQFNDILGPDPFGHRGRPDCETLLDGEAQRDFLARYATDFLTTIFSDDPEAVREARSRMGMDAESPAPAELYGLPAKVSVLAAAADRHTLLVPTNAAELTTNRAGGAVTADKITTHFCEAGYYTPQMKPGSEPCRRVNLTIPGQPALAVVSWPESGGALRLALPEGAGDLSDAAAISLRAAVDPLSPLNATGEPQAFTVQLTDATGKTATVPTRPDEPALQFPPGLVEENPSFEGGLFTGLVPMTTIRLPLDAFEGVDLSAISEIALLFDQTPSGSLFMGDLEWVRSAPQ